MNILITGAASGIGFETLKYYLNNNHQVYALDLMQVEYNNPNLKYFKTDITSLADILNVTNYFTEQNIKLDLIISIAGIHRMASLVESDFNLIKKVIDINLNGTMHLINKTHKFLKEKGKIILLTSEVAGFDPLPFNGIYSISKIALENYAQSLRQELNLLNQQVITIRPGAVKTTLAMNSLVDTENLAKETKLFKKESKKFVTITKKFMGTPIEPVKVARLIYKVSLKKHPRYSYKIHQNLGLVLLNILPKRVQCFLIKLILK